MTNENTHYGCDICNSKMEYFFSKYYDAYEGCPFEKEIKIDYLKCVNCGFVISKTHKEMTVDQWGILNSSWHHNFERDLESRTNNQPPYAEQALAVSLLQRNGLIPQGKILDYAAGYGTLAKTLKKYFNIQIEIFDMYVEDRNSTLMYVDEIQRGASTFVINSAMFEHVINRQGLDEVNNLVSEDGILMIHTLVCEKIPKDPNWFYLNPIVHTAFHTNKSMNILMKQWNYVSSVYSPQAKSWFLFKDGYAKLFDIENSIKEINKEIQKNFFHYKEGFLDYWKGY